MKIGFRPNESSPEEDHEDVEPKFKVTVHIEDGRAYIKEFETEDEAREYAGNIKTKGLEWFDGKWMDFYPLHRIEKVRVEAVFDEEDDEYVDAVGEHMQCSGCECGTEDEGDGQEQRAR